MVLELVSGRVGRRQLFLLTDFRKDIDSGRLITVHFYCHIEQQNEISDMMFDDSYLVRKTTVLTPLFLYIAESWIL